VRNFLLFVHRFFNLILFLFLEVICFVLLARTNSIQGNDVMSSANMFVGSIYKKQNDIAYYFELRKMNDSLINENLRLRMLMAQMKTVDTLKDSTVSKTFTENDSTHIVHNADYIYREARVINNSVIASNNYITIDRGSNQGIQKNMAVISGNGIVGEVVHVSGNYASILSALNVKRKVSARLKDGTTGFVSWENNDPNMLVMEDIPGEKKVYRNDSVFTTSYSLFPAETLIGTIWKRKINKKTNQQILFLRSATNFRDLQYVYVVEDKTKKEKTALEATNKEDK
jgi:rod shape-determining protein MreC